MLVRAFRVIVPAALLVPVLFVLAPASGVGGPCEGYRIEPGIGAVCPQPDGLLLVLSDTGQPLGYVHGIDPVPAEDEVAPAFGTTPHCVSGAAGDYYVRAIYARAYNDVDNYNTTIATIRSLVGSANKLVDDAALATGDRADLRVLCSGTTIRVDLAVLPTAKASASFSTIVSDLASQGFTNTRVKHWIFYDDTGACGCGGTGHIYGDDSLAIGNANNGNAGTMFAVNFGYSSVRIWMHELGHNLGAVQLSAPRTTGAYHCVDGLDTMCYSDGGPTSGNYTTSACATEIFDCGKNDYFHAAPAAGSYLATHWNLGNRLNRYLVFHTPIMQSVSCPTAEVGKPLTCTFSATDDSTAVTYTVTWGDSATSTLGPVAPGVSRSLSHTYTSVGNFTVGVKAVDNGSPALTSATKTATAGVQYDLTPPTLTVFEPRSGNAYDGCGIVQPIPVARTVFAQRGCAIVSASDAKTGIAKVEAFMGNTLVATDTSAPYQLEWPTSPGVAQTLRLVATDGAGNTASATRTVDSL